MNPYQVLNLPAAAGKAEIREAYRALARRWHPDRFMEGPERDWASEKMAEINAAYAACMRGSNAKPRNAEAEGRTLRQIEEMIDGGDYERARRMLMSITTRCAEWNYLFGAILMKTCETRKALIYLSVAAHQQPENAKYAQALRQAQNIGEKGRLKDAIRRRFRGF